VKIVKRIGFLLGIAIVGALVFYAYAVAADTGYLTRWELRGGLPESATRALTPDLVVTSSGHMYQHIPFCTDNCWQLVVTPTNNLNRPLSLDACGWMPATSHYLQSIATCESYGPGGTATRILAIDQKGNVYAWEHYKGEGGIILITIAPYLGAFLGLVIGVIFLVLHWVVTHRKQRYEGSQKNIMIDSGY
jgi:hypothetical protein